MKKLAKSISVLIDIFIGIIVILSIVIPWAYGTLKIFQLIF